MIKVSVFTVLTCFLAGTANLSYCYAGNSSPFSSWFGDNGDDHSRDKPKSSPSAGRGAGRGSEPAQLPTSAGRGAGRGTVPTQPSTSVGRGFSPAPSVHPTPSPSPTPSLEPKLPDNSIHSETRASQPMTEAELALYEQWVAQGKVQGIVVSKYPSSQDTGLMEARRVESLSSSTTPSPHPTPSLATSSLASGGDTEQPVRHSPTPAFSSSVIDDERNKRDNTIFLYAPQSAIIVNKGNYQLAKVALLCVVSAWENIREAYKNPAVRKLRDEESPEKNIEKLNKRVRWAKYYLSKKGKALQRPEAKAFSDLIEARMNVLIEEIKKSVESEEEPSVFIRFQQDEANERIMFSVERELGEVILVEIPGQEL